MLINENLLLNNGAIEEFYSSKQIIFNEASVPRFYFQIVEGIVELNNYHIDGKEFTQNILSEGQSIGEALLFTNKTYPMRAVAKTDCIILKLPKSHFLTLVHQNPEITFNIMQCLADRLYYKYIMLFNISSPDPVFRITTILDYLKSFSPNKSPFSYQVNLSRKQLANLTGLRIETVIRCIKRMEQEKIVKIRSRKIFY